MPGRLGKSSEGPFDYSYKSRIVLACLVSLDHCKGLHGPSRKEKKKKNKTTEPLLCEEVNFSTGTDNLGTEINQSML